MTTNPILLFKFDSSHAVLFPPPPSDAPFLLNTVESERAKRFATTALAKRWSVLRWQSRQVLATNLGIRPEDLDWQESPSGKPFLGNFPEFRFNLSHSGDWLGLAWSHAGEVGIDVEIISPDFPWQDVAADFFRPEEVAVLAQLPPPQARERFYHFWTAKEALMKSTGLGMQLAPNEIRLKLDGEGNVLGYESPPQGNWRFASGQEGTVAWAVASQA